MSKLHSFPGIVISGLYMLHFKTTHTGALTHTQVHTCTLGIDKMHAHTHTIASSHSVRQVQAAGLRVIGMSFHCFWRGIRFPIPLDLAPLCFPSGPAANEQDRHSKTGPAKRLICRRHPHGRVDLIHVKPKMQ